MIHMADIALHALHLAVIIICIFGWIPARFRRAHLALMSGIGACWFLLGLRFGLGYCPLTDWHWRIKRQLGETALPNSYIKYCWDQLSSSPITLPAANTLTFAAFFVALFISLYLNWAARDRKRVD